MIGVLTGKEPPMKDTARRRTKIQETTTEQVMFAAMRDARATLHEAVVAAGMTVLSAMLEEDRTKLCGPRYVHDRDRSALRAGYTDGELAMGGRRVRVRRPRVRGADGGELQLETWERFSEADPLTPRAVEQMVLGVSTRNYERSLDSMPAASRSRGTSKSAVSRRFVGATREKLAEMMSRDLSTLPICTVMIDGIHVGEHLVLIALGIDEHGEKHVLAVYEGATENATVCTALLQDLVARGLKADRTMLFVIDGSKALCKAIRSVFGARALLQRCQVHKRRNVEDHLPEDAKKNVGRAMAAAYGCSDPARARRMLEALARQLERKHPAAAASLREGLDETLTVLRFDLPDGLTRTLATTNPIEFLNGRIRKTTHNVTRWESGEMVLRWLAQAAHEASKTFRKLRGYKAMPKLVAALRAHDATIDPTAIDDSKRAA
jgi:transposase-like protein